MQSEFTVLHGAIHELTGLKQKFEKNKKLLKLVGT